MRRARELGLPRCPCRRQLAAEVTQEAVAVAADDAETLRLITDSVEDGFRMIM